MSQRLRIIHACSQITENIRNKQIKWNFINVYGAAQDNRKENFLRELPVFCSNNRYPMLVGGDFNVLRWEKRQNKPGGNNRWSFLFNDIIAHYNLIELDLMGRLYMWSNNREPPTFEKLDRILVSPDWDLTYINVMVSLKQIIFG
jgi:hypothetical protein